ncbi:hypothetical protein MOV61_19400 [Neorhizobium sp. BETTINA12A]|jgi:hypothetical protein|uniref:hypothetical protein n=1 Tax=Neorhizobium sp. BETTINA12A TaxID=2908924 RepID=UPI000A54510D|nr:hypothetical protein [Neorhizobium sp. BETTINA12A]MCJ9752887.1 hypothetical protein [Neorhizobium sp. BETTINA12A]
MLDWRSHASQPITTLAKSTAAKPKKVSRLDNGFLMLISFICPSKLCPAKAEGSRPAGGNANPEENYVEIG